MNPVSYRGRLAPSPTGLLHLGHARTFWTAQQRAKSHRGQLVLRNEDLDSSRCKPEFVAAMFEDLRWFGFRWNEGPDRGGSFGPYSQSERRKFYVAAFEKLRAGGFIYPCVCSRQDVLRSVRAPHEGEDEPLYPGTCRPDPDSPLPVEGFQVKDGIERPATRINWRFIVPASEVVTFTDGFFGPQQFTSGVDFGDFVVWRHDDMPSYQLSVVVDDAAMQVTEVVRGADLLLSTARQLLLYRALGFAPPAFYHCPLVTDEAGVRLAKRHDSLSFRTLRQQGVAPEIVREKIKVKGAAAL